MDPKRSKRLQNKPPNPDRILFDDSTVKLPIWTPEQEDLIAKAELIGIWSLNPQDESLKDSHIIFHRKDQFTSDNLRQRLTTGLANNQIKFQPTERVTWNPPDLFSKVVSDDIINDYYPGTEGTSCCPACNTECGESCLCRYTKIECRHVHSCPKTTIRDGRFPVTVVCEQHYTDEKGVEMKMLGVRTMEDIEKGQVVGVYCGTIISQNKNFNHPSSYSINISKDMKKLKDQRILIDGYPHGNTMILVNAPGSPKIANVKFTLIQTCNTYIPVLQATRAIKKNSFLFFDYGEEFWTDGFERAQPKDFKDPLYPEPEDAAQVDAVPIENVTMTSPPIIIVVDEQQKSSGFAIGDSVVVELGFYRDQIGVVHEIVSEFSIVYIGAFDILRAIPLAVLKKIQLI